MMLGAGALLLVADSADDGDSATSIACASELPAATFNATFTSTCPGTYAPGQGTLELALSASKSGDTVGLHQALMRAGFRASGESIDCSERASFDISATSGQYLRCSGFRYDTASQTITCVAGTFNDGGASSPEPSCSITFTRTGT